MNKAPVLSDNQIYNVFAKAMNDCNDTEDMKQWAAKKAVAQVQNDADDAYYRPLIEQATYQRNLLATALLNVLRKARILNNDTEPNGAELIMFAENFCEHNPIQQAKQEIAMEIFGKIAPIVDKLFEALDHADFSNGIEANGVDEGRVRASQHIGELTREWQSLKSKYLNKYCVDCNGEVAVKLEDCLKFKEEK